MTAPIDHSEDKIDMIHKTRAMARYMTVWRGRHVDCCIPRSPGSDDLFCQIFSVPSQYAVEHQKSLKFDSPSKIA